METAKLKQIKKFAKVYHKFMEIETEKDLRKQRLSLSDYREIEDIVISLCKIDGCSESTISKRVADWFRKSGFSVFDTEIGYEIMIM